MMAAVILHTWGGWSSGGTPFGGLIGAVVWVCGFAATGEVGI